MASKIFISHASQDRRIAESLCAALESRGLRCWLAVRDVAGGENFQAEIVRSIRAAKVMLLVFTANANNSDEIKKELVLASKDRLIVIPLRVEDVTPDDAFAYELATRQWIDMFDDWQGGLGNVAARIALILTEMPQPGEPVQVPPLRHVPQATACDVGPAPGDDVPAFINPAEPDRERKAVDSWPAYLRRRGWAILSGVLAIGSAVTFLALARYEAIPIAVSVPPRDVSRTETAAASAIDSGLKQHAGPVDPAASEITSPPSAKEHPPVGAGQPPIGGPAASVAKQPPRPPPSLAKDSVARSLKPSALDAGTAVAAKPQISAVAAKAKGDEALARNDYAEALGWYREAANQGSASAQNNLGSLYASGKGVKQDDAEAVRWYRRAAEQGLATAQNNLGWSYHLGKGVEQNDAEAIRWCRKAAEQNEMFSQFNIGILYQNGWGVKQDYAEAVRWYRKAATQGLIGAQYNLAVLLENGFGAPRDPTEARSLMQALASIGNADAKQWLASH